MAALNRSRCARPTASAAASTARTICSPGLSAAGAGPAASGRRHGMHRLANRAPRRQRRHERSARERDPRRSCAGSILRSQQPSPQRTRRAQRVARQASVCSVISVVKNLPGMVMIRPADPGEAEALEPLARAAKAVWGYSATQLDRWRDDLTLSTASIRRYPTFVAEVDGAPVGVAQVSTDGSPWGSSISGCIPTGCAGASAGTPARPPWTRRRREEAALLIDADPHAEAFYLAAGAQRVGAVAAPIAGQPDRVLPRLLSPPVSHDPDDADLDRSGEHARASATRANADRPRAAIRAARCLRPRS